MRAPTWTHWSGTSSSNLDSWSTTTPSETRPPPWEQRKSGSLRGWEETRGCTFPRESSSRFRLLTVLAPKVKLDLTQGHLPLIVVTPSETSTNPTYTAFPQVQETDYSSLGFPLIEEQEISIRNPDPIPISMSFLDFPDNENDNEHQNEERPEKKVQKKKSRSSTGGGGRASLGGTTKDIEERRLQDRLRQRRCRARKKVTFLINSRNSRRSWLRKQSWPERSNCALVVKSLLIEYILPVICRYFEICPSYTLLCIRFDKYNWSLTCFL